MVPKLRVQQELDRFGMVTVCYHHQGQRHSQGLPEGRHGQTGSVLAAALPQLLKFLRTAPKHPLHCRNVANDGPSSKNALFVEDFVIIFFHFQSLARTHLPSSS